MFLIQTRRLDFLINFYDKRIDSIYLQVRIRTITFAKET